MRKAARILAMSLGIFQELAVLNMDILYNQLLHTFL